MCLSTIYNFRQFCRYMEQQWCHDNRFSNVIFSRPTSTYKQAHAAEDFVLYNNYVVIERNNGVHNILGIRF